MDDRSSEDAKGSTGKEGWLGSIKDSERAEGGGERILLCRFDSPNAIEGVEEENGCPKGFLLALGRLKCVLGMAGNGGRFSLVVKASRKAADDFDLKIFSIPRFQEDFNLAGCTGNTGEYSAFSEEERNDGGDSIDALDKAGEEFDM